MSVCLSVTVRLLLKLERESSHDSLMIIVYVSPPNPEPCYLVSVTIKYFALEWQSCSNLEVLTRLWFIFRIFRVVWASKKYPINFPSSSFAAVDPGISRVATLLVVRVLRRVWTGSQGSSLRQEYKIWVDSTPEFLETPLFFSIIERLNLKLFEFSQLSF